MKQWQEILDVAATFGEAGTVRMVKLLEILGKYDKLESEPGWFEISPSKDFVILCCESPPAVMAPEDVEVLHENGCAYNAGYDDPWSVPMSPAWW